MKLWLIILVVVAAALALTNPSEADFRAHIQERQGIFGTLGLALTDLLSADSRKGVHRENYILFSKFYIGGDGILPRQDLGWGIAGKCFEKEFPEDERERKR